MTPETRAKSTGTPDSFLGAMVVVLGFGGARRKVPDQVQLEPIAAMNVILGVPGCPEQELLVGAGGQSQREGL